MIGIIVPKQNILKEAAGNLSLTSCQKDKADGCATHASDLESKAAGTISQATRLLGGVMLLDAEDKKARILSEGGCDCLLDPFERSQGSYKYSSGTWKWNYNTRNLQVDGNIFGPQSRLEPGPYQKPTRRSSSIAGATATNLMVEEHA